MLPFVGSIEFKLAIAAFGTRVIRQARIDYAYRPAWPYYDAEAGAERTADFALDLDLLLLARSIAGAKRNPSQSSRRTWQSAGQLLAAGVLSARLLEVLRQRVDEAAHAADRVNRLRAGQSVPALPDQI